MPLPEMGPQETEAFMRRVVNGVDHLERLYEALGRVPADMRAQQRRVCLESMAVSSVIAGSPEKVIDSLQAVMTAAHCFIHDLADIEHVDCQCKQNPIMQEPD